MRAIVSGADGCVGQRIALRLSRDGWDVLGITQVPEGDGQRGWPKRAGAFGASLAGAEVLFLTDIADGVSRPALARDMTGLIDAAIKAGVGRVVLLSSAGQYAAADAPEVPLDETAPLDAPEEMAPLPAAAFAVEQHLDAAPVESVTLRALDVLSPDSAAIRITVARALDNAANDWPLSHLHPIDADDLADLAIKAAVTRQAAGHVLNVAGPETALAREAVQEIREVAALLSDDGFSGIRVRPAYSECPPVLNTARAYQVLSLAPKRRLWHGLSQITQSILAARQADGSEATHRAEVPAAVLALERRETPMAGKTAIVTGATHGIGRETALLLSRLGADVLAIGRDAGAGAALEAETQAHSACRPVRFIAADLSLQSELRTLASRLEQAYPRIDLLVNNAAALFPERTLTAEGVEATLATNLLAPFLLSHLLVGPLSAAGGRIVNIGCEAHERAMIDLDDLQGEQGYDMNTAYARSKFSLVMLGYCLTAASAETRLSVMTLDPGETRSGLMSQAEALTLSALEGDPLQHRTVAVEKLQGQLQSPRVAAQYIAELAVSPKFQTLNGCYVIRDAVARSDPGTYDQAQAWKLWDACMALVGLAEEDDAA